MPRPEVEAVGVVAEVEQEVPQRRASPCRPTPPPAPGRPGAIMSNSSMALATWSRHSCRKCSAQKLALWRRMSMTAGSRQTRHFTVRRRHPGATSTRPRSPGGSRRRRRRRASASPATRVSSRITSTDSRLMSSRSSRATTCSGPGTSTSRRGLRSRTFTPTIVASPRCGANPAVARAPTDRAGDRRVSSRRRRRTWPSAGRAGRPSWRPSAPGARPPARGRRPCGPCATCACPW